MNKSTDSGTGSLQLKGSLWSVCLVTKHVSPQTSSCWSTQWVKPLRKPEVTSYRWFFSVLNKQTSGKLRMLFGIQGQFGPKSPPAALYSPTQVNQNGCSDFSLCSSPPPKIVFNRLNGKRHNGTAAQRSQSPAAEGFTPAHEENVRFVYEGEDHRIRGPRGQTSWLGMYW